MIPSIEYNTIKYCLVESNKTRMAFLQCSVMCKIVLLVVCWSVLSYSVPLCVKLSFWRSVGQFCPLSWPEVSLVHARKTEHQFVGRTVLHTIILVWWNAREYYTQKKNFSISNISHVQWQRKNIENRIVAKHQNYTHTANW